MCSVEIVRKVVREWEWKYGDIVLRGRLVYSNYFNGSGDIEDGEEYVNSRYQDNWELVVQCLDGQWMGGAIFFNLEKAIAAVEKKFPTNFVRWITV